MVAISTLLIFTAKSTALGDAPMTVTATYYGGEYDETKNTWVIDNTDQCSRIAAGEFTADSLGAMVAPTCDDDSGLGYVDDVRLHNRVAFAELSNPPGYSDYSALGGLPAGTRLEINYRGKCVIAEKLDEGTGGDGMGGSPRAIDLWWQTARSLGFSSGFDTVVISKVPGSTPLTALGRTSACGVTASVSSPGQQNAKKPNSASPNPQAQQNSGQDATDDEPDSSPTDMKSKAFVRLQDSESARHGPRLNKFSWYRVAVYGVIVIFTLAELWLGYVMLRRRKRGKARSNVRQRKKR